MSTYVVIAQSPTVDVSQVVGMFRSYDAARATSSALEDKGYNTEIAEVVKLSDVDDSPAWDYSTDNDWDRL